MSTLRQLLLVALFIAGTGRVGAQDLLVKTNGDSLNVKILEKTAEGLSFRMRWQGKARTIFAYNHQLLHYEVGFFKRNRTGSIQLDFMGASSIFALGYEHQFLRRPRAFLTYKASLGYSEELIVISFGTEPEPERFTIFTNQVTANYGLGNHFLEAGIGGDFISSDQGNKAFLAYPTLGYGLQTSVIIFRIYTTPAIVGKQPEALLFAPLGFSFGVRI